MGKEIFNREEDFIGVWILRNGTKVLILEKQPTMEDIFKYLDEGYCGVFELASVPNYWNDWGNSLQNREFDLVERIRDYVRERTDR